MIIKKTTVESLLTKLKVLEALFMNEKITLKHQNIMKNMIIIKKIK